MLTVGFDLDMTLLDTRPGIRAAYVALAEKTGVAIDADAAVTRLGPPLRWELARWFPADQVEEIVPVYRELYERYAIAPTVPMPGAVEALGAVRAAGGRSVVVTAKVAYLAHRHLAHAGLTVDAVCGDHFADAKGEALARENARVYVGDHVADMTAARTGRAVGVGVTTGPCGEAELRAAGADVVIADLTAFPAWLAGHLG